MEDMLERLEQKMEVEGATEANLREFWKLANRAKLEKHISESTLDRIVRLRDALFNRFYPPFVSLSQGLILMAAVIVVGPVLIWFALQSNQLLFFLIGSVLLMVGTHPWGHWVAGRFVRVRYEYFYLDGPARFEPCLKIDYRTYLKASFDSRIIVHASGALSTFLTALILFVMSLSAYSFEIRSIGVLIFVAVAITEVIAFAGFASGDLKRVRREGKLKKLYAKRRSNT